MIALIRMIAGLLVWAAAFCLLYGLHGIGCARGWDAISAGPASLHRTVLTGAWLACLIAGGLLLIHLRRARHAPGLLDRTAVHVALTGLAATAVTGLPILTLPACL